MNIFKLWSDANRTAKERLSPQFKLRGWDDISYDDRRNILQHFEHYFYESESAGYSQYVLVVSNVCRKAFNVLNSLHKVEPIAKNYLHYKTHLSAENDLLFIFQEGTEDIFLEFISVFINIVLVEPWIVENRWRIDTFKDDLNDMFCQYNINVQISHDQIIPRQDDKITEDIYEPVLEILSNKKWKEVSLQLNKAFASFRDQKYANAISETVIAIEAYLSIKLYGKIGNGTLGQLITEMKNKHIAKDSTLSLSFIQLIKPLYARARKEMGNAHPSVNDSASSDEALLMLNLAMIFIQHCK